MHQKPPRYLGSEGVNSTLQHSREHELIAKIKEWTGSTLIGDDCAVIDGGLLVSTDSLVEGTHFDLATTSFNDLGWKAAAVNLSDVAAMAGRARYLLIGLGCPPYVSESDIRQFYEGFTDCARAYKARIAGGDLFRSAQMVLSITVLGHAHEHGSLTRRGASNADIVAVTGDFGASAAGFHLLNHLQLLESDNVGQYCISRHLKPLPRLCQSWALARAARGRATLMDASDGLADALVQLSRESGLGMTIDLDKVPVHDETLALARRSGINPLDWILYGGEDYELVACIPPDVWALLAAAEADNPFIRVGVVDETKEITLNAGGSSGPRLDLSRGFQHFQKG